MLTVGLKQETHSSLLDYSPVLRRPILPSQPTWTPWQRHLNSFFAPVVITTATTGCCHMMANICQTAKDRLTIYYDYGS